MTQPNEGTEEKLEIENFLRLKGILWPKFNEWVVRFEDGKELVINNLIHEFTDQKTKSLRDQLSKEREKNYGDYWRSQFSFLQKDYNEKCHELEKEREIRNELVAEIKVLLTVAKRHIQDDHIEEIEAVLKQANDLKT